VQGGVTNHVPISTFLTGDGTNAHFGIIQAGGSITVGNLGSPEIVAASGKPTIFTSNSGDWLLEDGAGNIAIDAPVGGTVSIGANGSLIECATTGDIILQASTGYDVIATYLLRDASFWVSSPPPTINEAISRIAAKLSNNGATPIP
jgi:hypothetical protein